MAAQMSFRQQCPSCETLVTIKDHALVGRKVDCPKCKYRFVVEDPSAGVEVIDDDDTPAPTKKAAPGKKPVKATRRPAEDDEDDDAPRRAKPKKKGGGNGMVIGAVVGGVALVLLGVGAYLIFFSGDSPPPKVNSTRPPVASNTNSGREMPTKTPDTPPADAPKTDTPAAVAAGGGDHGAEAATNLLPNDAEVVVSVFFDHLRNCTAGQQAFESRTGFKPDTLAAKLGISHEDIDRLVRAENVQGNWAFNVIHTTKPYNLAAVKKATGASKGSKSPIKGKEYFTLEANDFLDNIGVILQSELESIQSKAPKAKKSSANAGPLTLFSYDSHTLVIANAEPMEEFLQSGTKPKHLSIAKKEGDANSNSGGGGGGGRGDKNSGGGGGGDSGNDGPQHAERATYLTVEPKLKSMLDKLETADKDHPAILAIAHDAQADPKIAARIAEATGQSGLVTGLGMKIVGMGVYQYNSEKFKSTLGVEFTRREFAKGAEAILKKQLAVFALQMRVYLDPIGMKIEAEGADPLPPDLAASLGGTDPTSPTGDTANPSAGVIAQRRDPIKSTIKFDLKGNTLMFSMDLGLSLRGYDRIYGISASMVSRMKGRVDMAGGVPHWAELFKAAKAKMDEKKQGIRGTFAREDGVGSKLARTWPPNHRVSWMAGLLPALGHDDVYSDIQTNRNWREDMNLKAGGSLIPEFLDPRLPPPTWRARPSHLGGRDLGATHYAGMAGVGDDAADYRLDDASKAKKLGFFGYDRSVKLTEVTDGLANTIYMIQVPPGHPRPWIAGGGATVVAAPETKSFAPFAQRLGGKIGTFAIMGDGSVRFIGDGISDETFKALCTIKGGETLDDLNKIAPKAAIPTKAEQKTDEAEKDKAEQAANGAGDAKP